MKLLSYISLIAISLFTLVGCGGDTAESKLMATADSIMAEHPDSALTLLSSIDPVKLGSDREKARYALLMSMALDKNYIDTTTFDVLQPAIDYYLNHGTADERLKTLYYQGRIFQNGGNDEEAMRSFLTAGDLMGQATDTLMLAHALVAQGTILIKQYKAEEYTQNNLAAAHLYGAIGQGIFQLKSYANALSGYILMDNKQKADSMMSICCELDRQIDSDDDYLFSSIVSYVTEFGSPDEIREFMAGFEAADLSADDAMNFAYGYSKIGDYERAMDILSNTAIPPSALDSLKYLSVKIDITEKHNGEAPTNDLYRDYAMLLERYHQKLLSDDRLFAHSKHEIEVKQLEQIHKRDNVIWASALAVLVLLAIIGGMYYRYRLTDSNRRLVEKNNECLRLKNENLRIQKQQAELERDKKILEAKNLETEAANLRIQKQQAELERDKKILEAKNLETEAANLRIQKQRAELERDIKILESKNLKMEAKCLRLEKEKAEIERDNKMLEAKALETEKCRIEAESELQKLETEALKQEKINIEHECQILKNLIKEQTGLDAPIIKIMEQRLDLLNGLLANALSKNEVNNPHTRKFIESIKKKSAEFVENTKGIIMFLHPKFIGYLKSKGLTEQEIDVACLFAIGLKGVGVGELIQCKGHYSVSSDIRRKLELGERDTNLDIFLRNLMAELDAQ